MVDVNTVYQKVLALANKEQRGYITPQEFNLLADRAQNEIFENYFHGVKMAEMKPKNQMNYADEVEMLEEKLHPFYEEEFVNTSAATLILPDDIHKIIDITRNGNKVTQVNKSQVAYTENNPLTKATLTRSVFVREDVNLLGSSRVTIYPAPSSSTYNLVILTSAPGLNNDTEQFEVIYYRKPVSPTWGYVVAISGAGKALYNSNTSTNFELHGSEEESLVSRILLSAGITIKQPELGAAGVGSIQLTKQEQNS